MERFAVLIGIDDQDSDGLPPYCVKDANEIGEVLEDFCGFKKKNIFKILSPKNKENTSSIAELENSIDILIKERKLDADDLFFFYFSGHGKFDIGTQHSSLVFPDGNLQTTKIKDYLDRLHPKAAILLLDACFIGSKLFSKSANNEKLKRKFYIDSEVVYGIYASPTSREAYMPPKLTNSLLTHFFIDTIRNKENYDNDGYLSIEHVAAICAKKSYKYSIDMVSAKQITKEQVIVREGRIEGYIPFAEIAVGITTSRIVSRNFLSVYSKQQKILS